MAEFNEEYYFEQFGVSPQTTDGEEAEVSENPEETPEDVRKPETEPNEEPVDAQPEESEEGAAKPKQTKKENAQFAAARRKAEAERDAAIEAERQKAKADVDALIADMGLENPYTNQPITTKAEYDEYKATHAQKQQEQRLREMNMTQEEYTDYVSELPEVKEARQQLAQTQKQEFKRRMDEEIRSIGALNPAIKSIEDLVQEEKYETVKGYVDQGHNLYDAYRLAHFDDLTQRKGRQQAINQAGKAHMTSTQSRGGEGPVNVPKDELDMFHQLCPGLSDDRIAKFYNQQIQNE